VLAEDAFFTMGGAMGNTWMTLTQEDAARIYEMSL